LKGTGKHLFVAAFLYHLCFHKSFLISRLGEIFKNKRVWLSLCIYI
jgi:hypothetical protein